MKKKIQQPLIEQVKEFCKLKKGNQWLQGSNLDIYFRIGKRYWPNSKKVTRTLDIATITSLKPGKGHFTRFLTELESIQKDLGLVYYVENVQTKRFRNFFRKRGWSELGVGEKGYQELDNGSTGCFYRLIPSVQAVQENLSENQLQLPNGCTLYWKDNGVGGRTYTSDEVGGGVIVWDTCCVSDSTLLAAMAQEARLSYQEKVTKKKELTYHQQLSTGNQFTGRD